MKTKACFISILFTMLILMGCHMNTAINMPPEAFIAQHVETIAPLRKEANLASWDAAVSGKPEDYERQKQLTLKIRNIYSDPDEFAYLKNLMESDMPLDPVTARQIKILYNAYLPNQIDPSLVRDIVALESEIQKNFSTFRGSMDGKEVTVNDISAILKDETDSEKRKRAWLASKQVGPVVAEDVLKLVRLRNQGAKQVGYDSYHTLMLEKSELDVAELDRLFEELEQLTRKPYADLKAQLDRTLAANCNIESSEIMPWHYHDPFLQEAPMVIKIDLDEFYKGKDIVALSADFYDGIGLNTEAILENSDLFEKPGKNPHAFCSDIDKEGDVRILCNIRDNEKWMEVQLHESGHAVYARYHDMNVPYLLRNPAHSFTTEAVAMIFGRLSGDALWMQYMLGLSDAQRDQLLSVTREHTQLGQLIFARWVLVMYHFEKQLYADPDQDLNTLWWDMVEKYQFVKRPQNRAQPDWASKIHFVIAPCYYHNYMLGEMLASQLIHDMAEKFPAIDTDKGVRFVNQKEIGTYLRDKIFKPGNVTPYNEMIQRATGESLTPKYFVQDFVN